MANEDARRAPEAEGIPDLEEQPAPGKEETGDPQQGIMPPRDHPVAVDEHGTTAAEQRRGESQAERLLRTTPDVDERSPRDAEPQDESASRLEEQHAQGRDVEKQALAEETGDDRALSAEEAAVRRDER